MHTSTGGHQCYAVAVSSTGKHSAASSCSVGCGAARCLAQEGGKPTQSSRDRVSVLIAADCGQLMASHGWVGLLRLVLGVMGSVCRGGEGERALKLQERDTHGHVHVLSAKRCVLFLLLSISFFLSLPFHVSPSLYLFPFSLPPLSSLSSLPEYIQFQMLPEAATKTCFSRSHRLPSPLYFS